MLVFIRVEIPDEAVVVALISGCTTVAVTCVRAAAQVAVAWLQKDQSPPPPPPREIEPPAPDP